MDKEATAGEMSLSGLKERMLVQKTSQLASLRLPLRVCKLIDVYLARINSHEQEARRVTISKQDFESVLGVKRIRTEDLTQLLHTLNNEVIIHHKNGDSASIKLFDEAFYTNGVGGLLDITLKCSDDAMRYIFNIDKDGYIKYYIDSVAAIKSQYTYRLYMYLLMNAFRQKWRVDVPKLREILDANEPHYAEFANFKKKVLSIAKAELKKIDDINFDVSPVKRGRTVIALEFVVKAKESCKNTVERPTKAVEATSNTEDNNEWKYPLWYEALQDMHLQECQMTEIRTILAYVPESKLPSCQLTAEVIECKQYDYVKMQYAELKSREKLFDIRNPYAYFVAMIKNDTKSDN